MADETDRIDDDLLRQLRGIDVAHFLVSYVSTLASLAYSKLETAELPQAKLAIDAASALVPLVPAELQRDLAQAVANLQIAYASAASQ